MGEGIEPAPPSALRIMSKTGAGGMGSFILRTLTNVGVPRDSKRS
jgi:hypothetical protein